ncbi:TetR/AcrR family transcriptional regulator [Clostridium estertheticum]|uniref:TetR/AcrR family transcriptional regulator n=1 Tax=Clostridium estertheticum TaxID=238834 RepID=UPI001C7DFB95|nr:TetR/AcrR family transcriptional regulator [Clostridium estertheticum]MBX4270068.1 TetR/AcrR family transcriptional regulator [Clostridium estertheticum]WLC80271.1 TetR/AcrR family transcriptional regulator [Clostridium estertheticum]
MDKQITDRRIRKTKKLLREALTELMSEKKLENITIKDLTGKADLNRGTFYLHYRDIYDLLEQSEDGVLEEINIIMSKFDSSALIEFNLKNDPFPPLVELLEYFADNMNFCETLMGPKGNISFLERLTAILKKEYTKWVEIYGKKNDMIFNEYFIDYSQFGFIGIIKKWFDSNMETPSKELAVIILKMLFNGLNY